MRRFIIALIFCIAGEVFSAQNSVTDYGAVPDDLTDDADAIQLAIDSTCCGNTLYFPAGTYLINKGLTVHSVMKMKGAVQSATIIKYNSGSAFDMISMVNTFNFEISDITLDGDNLTGNSGISAYKSGYISVHDMTIKNLNNAGGSHGLRFSGDNPTYLNGVTDIVVKDSTFSNFSTSSIWGSGMRFSWGCQRILIQNNTIDNMGRGGIFTNDGTTNVTIIKNTITKSGQAGSDALSIEIWNKCNNSIIEDNVVDHWISVGGADYVAVRRNTIRSLSGGSGFIGLEAIGHDCVFTDNLIDHNQQIGISSSNAYQNQYQYYAYNTVQYMLQFGVQIQGDSNEAKYMYFYKNKFLNTLRGAGGVYPGSDGMGFRINGGTHFVVLDSNEMRDNQANGIETGGALVDQFSIVNNTITNNAFSGIGAYPGSDLECSGNILSGNGSDVQPASMGFTDQKPVANFSLPAQLPPGQPITFTNTSTDADGTISHVLWDFAEGLPSNDMNAVHTYAAAGNYRVALIVWDNVGRASMKETTITVKVPVETPLSNDLNTAVVFPNPINLTNSPGKKIKMINLPANCTMTIYNSAGEQVRELKESDQTNNGTIEWDGKNQSGDTVSGGIYIYNVVDPKGSKKTGKIAIVK